MRLQKITKRVLPLLIIAAAVAIFMSLTASKPEQAPVPVQEKVWMVTYMEAKYETLSPMQRLYGQVESDKPVSMSAPMGGVIGEMSVKEGQQVKKGEAIVALDLQDLAIPLQQAKADYAEAGAQLKLEKLAYQANIERLAHEKRILEFKKSDVVRVTQLLKKDLTSTQALEQAKEALVKQEYVVVGSELSVEEHQLKTKQNEARLAKAEAAMQLAELNYQRGVVVAPYDGRIAKVLVSEGERVSTGTVMVEFYGLDSLELRARLPVRDFFRLDQRLRSGQVVQAFLNEENLPEVPLKLDRMAGEATASGIDLFFTVPQALLSIRPGDLLEVELQGSTIEQAVAVPYSALYGSDRLYLIEDERLKAVTVKVLGDLMVDGKLWALLSPTFPNGSQVSITHLPNAVTGLKVLGVPK